jgi:hypothetical protein
MWFSFVLSIKYEVYLIMSDFISSYLGCFGINRWHILGGSGEQYFLIFKLALYLFLMFFLVFFYKIKVIPPQNLTFEVLEFIA